MQLLMPICSSQQWGWQEPRLLSAAGFACSQVNKLEDARRFYQRWIEIEPDSARPFYCLGYIYYLEKDWRQAIRWFEQALKIYPEYLVCLYRLGYAYFSFMKPKQAIPLLEKVEEIFREKDDEDWRRRNLKNYCKAKFLLAKAYYRVYRFQDALGLLQELMQVDERDYVEKCFKHYGIGKTLVALNRPEEALQFLEQALDKNRPQPYVLDQMGRALHKMGNYPEALEHYGRALKIRRKTFILVNRALTLLKVGRSGEAVRDLHEALKRDRLGKHKIYLYLGKISMAGGRYKEAYHYFQQAIRFKEAIYQTGYADAHYELVLYHLQMKEKDKAQQEMQKALEINPHLKIEKSLMEQAGFDAGIASHVSSIMN